MRLEKYETLIKKLESRSLNNPLLYKMSVLIIAALGYAYIFLIIGLLLGGTAWAAYLASDSFKAFFWIMQIIFIPVLLVLMILRALIVSLPPPDGMYLDRRKFPKLYDTLDEIKKILKGPKIHEVLLDNQFNASIIQVPRLGIFGWYKNYLTIGLPILFGLNKDQIKIILSHEYGHISGSHGKFGSWIYRIRETWDNLLHGLERQAHWGAIFFKKFLAWYAPFFNAYSFVSARSHEFEADRIAANIADTQTVGDTLCTTAILGRYLNEDIWPHIYKQAEYEYSPISAFKVVEEMLRDSIPSELLNNKLEMELDVNTDIEDTHPCLRERLQALKAKPRVKIDNNQNAASWYLENKYNKFLAKINSQWQGEVKSYWNEQHNFLNEARKRLEVLEDKLGKEELELDDLWQYSQLVEQFHGIGTAIPHYQNFVKRFPDQAGAQLIVGSYLLENKEKKGVVHLEKAMELNDNCTLEVSYKLWKYAEAIGDAETASKHKELFNNREKEEIKASEERDNLSVNDHLTQHNISRDQLEELKHSVYMSNVPVRRAHLARKITKYMPNRPFFVLAVELADFNENTWYDDLYKLSESLILPHETRIFIINEHPDLQRKMTSVKYSCVFS